RRTLRFRDLYPTLELILLAQGSRNFDDSQAESISRCCLRLIARATLLLVGVGHFANLDVEGHRTPLAPHFHACARARLGFPNNTRKVGHLINIAPVEPRDDITRAHPSSVSRTTALNIADHGSQSLGQTNGFGHIF